MKLAIAILTAGLLGACSSADTAFSEPSSENQLECKIEPPAALGCERSVHGDTFRYELLTDFVAADEIHLLAVKVRSPLGSKELPVTPDTTMLAGDQGYLSFPDINFDGVADLALMTSFGTPNLYMDYWVYLPQAREYRAVGNYPQLQIDTSSKTLNAIVKENAAKYEKKVWQWENGQLVETNR